MKQKLLLALFVLFASIGAMRAETKITVPANSARVTLTFSGVGTGADAVTVTDAAATSTTTVFYLDPNNAGEHVIKGKYTGLTVDGWVSEATFDQTALTTLTFKNNGGNLASLGLTGTTLTTLNCDDCALTAVPTTGFSTSAAVSVSLKNNQINDISGFSMSRTAAITFNLDGNKIEKLPTTAIDAKISINYGMQYLESTEKPVANIWFDAFDKFVTTKSIFANVDVSNLNFTWKKSTASSFGTSDVIENEYKGQFKFYNSGSKEFQDGTYSCQIAHKTDSKLPKYVIGFTVKPATFNLKYTTKDDAENEFKIVDVSTGNEVTNNAPIEKGTQLLFSNTAQKGYAFKEYKVVGLVTTSTPNVYQVKGDGLNADVSAEAVFTANTYKVNFTAEPNGKYEITVNKEAFASGASFPIGTKIEVYAEGNASYTARVLVNNVDQTLADNKCTITTKNEITNISVVFEAGTKPMLTTIENANLTTVVVNKTTLTFTNSKNETPINANTVVTVNVTPKSTYKVKQILLDSKPLSGTSNVSFTMPEDGATLSFVTAELGKITVASATTDVVAKTQVHEYNGAKQAFVYKTDPVGFTDIKLEYSPVIIDNYTTDAPTSVGTYKVKATRAADDLYAKVEQTDLKISITKATPKITTAPTVTVNTDKTYNVSGGAAQLNGKAVTGKFTVTKAKGADVDNNVCVESSSHIAEVTFTAKSGNDNDPNYETVKTEVPVTIGTALTKYKVSYSGIPSGMTMTIKNGESVITNGTQVALGTKLTISVAYPVGYSNVKVKEDNAIGAELTTDKDDTNNVLTVTKTIDGVLALTVTATGEATPAKVLNIPAPTTVKSKEYTGEVLKPADLYAVTDFTPAVGNTPLASDALKEAQGKMVITYKDAAGKLVPSPINAGKYTVCINIPAYTSTETGTPLYKETNVEFKGQFVITKKAYAEADFTWPDKAIIGIGQTLEQAKFVGGTSPIAGKFAFVETTKTPTDGAKYTIKFIPADINNYNEVSVGKEATVILTNKRVLTIGNMVNGTVTVKDKATDVVYNSGAELPNTVKELVITAVPSTGYSVETLTVNGTAITSGATYTLGTASVDINATFSASFTVTVTAPSKGLIVTLPASNKVKAGGSYVITLAHLAADKPVVKEGSTTITGTDGKYTISNIMANKAITITLENPTAISVKADATLSPQGKSMGTITFTGLTDGKCFYGDKITAKATPVSGVQFSGWHGLTSTDNPLTMTVTTAALTLKALYGGSPTGIADIEGTKVYGAEGYIYVSCEGQATVTVVAMDGRAQQIRIVGEARIETGAGIYGVILQQGAETMKTKVVVR